MLKEAAKEKLIEAGIKDQEIRRRLFSEGMTPDLMEEMKRVDSENQALVKELVSEYGYLSPTSVGSKAAKAAFLIVQHMGKEDVAFMEDYLSAMKEEDLTSVSEHFALLQDRVLVYRGLPQSYGTQLKENPDTGKLEPSPIDDYENVDARRLELGLGSLEEYIAEANE